MKQTVAADELLPFALPLMRKTFKRHLSAAARNLFKHLQAMGDAQLERHPIDLHQLEHVYALLNDTFGILRHGAIDPALRHLDFNRTVSHRMGMTFVCVLYAAIAQIPLAVVRRHVTTDRLAALLAGQPGFFDWLPLLTDREREACIHDLAFERIDALSFGGEDAIDGAINTWLQNIRFMFCQQMIVVAIGRGDAMDIDAYVHMLNHVSDVLEGAVDDADTDALPVSAIQPNPIRLALPRMLVVPPMPWADFTVNWQEHFGQFELMSDEPTVEQWDWLTDDAHYLITFPADLLLGGPRSPVNHYLRRLVALSRCFRVDSDWSMDVERNRSTDAVINHAQPARCRSLALPLDVPVIFRAETLKWTADEMAELLDVRQHEFQLAGRPFVTPGELQDGWVSELEQGWAWLANARGHDAERLRHVLETFEVACTLAHSADVPDVHREGWQLVGLMQTVESLCGDRSAEFKSAAIDDETRKLLRATGETQATVDQCCGRLRTAYRQRNAFVHAGECDWNPGDLADVRHAVARVIRAAIRDAKKR